MNSIPCAEDTSHNGMRARAFSKWLSQCRERPAEIRWTRTRHSRWRKVILVMVSDGNKCTGDLSAAALAHYNSSQSSVLLAMSEHKIWSPECSNGVSKYSAASGTERLRRQNPTVSVCVRRCSKLSACERELSHIRAIIDILYVLNVLGNILWCFFFKENNQYDF